METLHEIILTKVQYKAKQELMRQLDEKHYYTGHGIVIKSLNDIKASVETYLINEMDTAERRLYLLMQ